MESSPPKHLHREEFIEVDMSELVGPYTWSALHHLVQTFPCDTCARHGGRLLRGLHDLVNVGLGKPLFAPRDFKFLVQEVGKAVHEVDLEHPMPANFDAEVKRLAVEVGVMPHTSAAGGFPACTGEDRRKFERCVQQVKGRGGVDSPFAVCTTSVGCTAR